MNETKKQPFVKSYGNLKREKTTTDKKKIREKSYINSIPHNPDF